VIVSTPTSNASNKKLSFIKRTTAAVQNKSRSIFGSGSKLSSGSARKSPQKGANLSTPNSAKIVRMQRQINMLTTANEEQTEILQDVAQKFEVALLCFPILSDFIFFQ
jgi:hypothetical protein